ncbi:MAG: hypothetical protein GXP54_09690 [Deltaproteobacteria bacterium]|nr:hypothetical protein [Deltaproteobacteria bacterium]
MNRLFDLHAHPSLKMHYLPWLTPTLHALVYSGNHFNPLSFRTRYANIRHSPYKVIVNAHYAIEHAFLKDFHWLFKGFAWLTGATYYGWLRTADPWKTLDRMMRTLESSAVATNRHVRKGKGPRVRICRRFADIADLEEDEIGIIHAIESPHCLGFPKKGQSRDEFWNQTKDRLRQLKERGVAMITLAHFYDNAFCPQIDSIELLPKMRSGKLEVVRDAGLFQMKRAEWKWGDPNHYCEEIVREMFRLGIVPDLSHVQEHARMKIYDIAEECGRPVTMSHVGLRHFFDNEYNATDEELLRIRKLGGVVGLILSKRWLVDPIDRYYAGGDGIPDLIEDMRYMRDLTGDVEVIGIGTDFDGMTHPFPDCFKPNHLGRIAHAMSKHFTDDEIDRIFFRNAVRLFENGWD